tara:strand:+ start:1278 stop:2612 length:1335 start_codon:yes stop_codon:yes gene_type:complete
MISVGISEGFHDASMTVIKDQEILYAGHSERYSQTKNDRWVHDDQWNNVDWYDNLAFYENYFWKNTRNFWSLQPKVKYKREYTHIFRHHETHAAAGYYTSPFNECNVIVIDSIGEWDTISIWECKDNEMKKIKSWKYPYSLGLFYSAITERIGFKPNEEEYITMGMAAYGEPKHDLEDMLYRNNHRGVHGLLPHAHPFDLAASAQNLYETKLLELLRYCEYSNLVLMGGCALNCVANSKIPDRFNIWIMPNPGDAGSSLGAVALIEKKKLNWKHPYLGEEIKQEVNPKEVVYHILQHGYCGVANGKAEFGPRALGNRSLLADPRLDIKDTVNEIKQREKFRPFAPTILEEYADEYFEGRKNRYMQFTSRAMHDYKSVTHVDGTARVQTVEIGCVSILRDILEEFYNQTGCPMLLNTSLNIKGKPMVNTWEDALEFERKYNVKVF